MNFFPTAYAAPEAHEATPSSADTGLLGSLGINLNSFVAQLFNFALVVAVVWFLILKPVTKKMAERQKLIDESLSNAQKIQDKMTKSEREYQDRIDQAKVEANKILEKATAEANTVGDTLKIKAKKDIELLVDQAKRNLAIEKDDMMAAVKKDAAELVVMALEKLLTEKSNAAEDKTSIETMLKQISYEKK